MNKQVFVCRGARPGHLPGGELTQAAKDRALEAMNQIRALHGLEPVQYSRRYDEQEQQNFVITGIE